MCMAVRLGQPAYGVRSRCLLPGISAKVSGKVSSKRLLRKSELRRLTHKATIIQCAPQTRQSALLPDA